MWLEGQMLPGVTQGFKEEFKDIPTILHERCSWSPAMKHLRNSFGLLV
jgi:hypothetical protein